jgi:hypothetical protein
MPGQNDRNAVWDDVDAAQAEPWQPLSADQAQALRATQPTVAP